MNNNLELKEFEKFLLENYGNNNEEEYKHFIDLMKNKTNFFGEEYEIRIQI